MINFQKLRYQNLLSTGNQFTEIHFNRSKSTLVVGENGAGKSSFIEALTFALYGKPFRNINKPQLVNSITGKHLLVELEFQIGKKKYLIRRGIKPAIFEIHVNGSLINQSADAREYQEMLERNILKLNFKSFSQIVVLGSANYIPFMQLAAQHRRGVVEDLLDIQIFSVMNSLLKEKIVQHRQDTLEVDHLIRQTEHKIELHAKYVASLRQNNDELISMRAAKIAEHEASLDHFKKSNAMQLENIEDLEKDSPDAAKISERKTKLVQAEAQLEERIRKLNRDIKFFHDHDNCPTCQQGIDHDFKSGTIEKRSSKLAEVQSALGALETQIAATTEQLKKVEQINREIARCNEQIASNNSNIKFANRSISELNNEIEELNKQATKIELDVDETSSYTKDLGRLKKQKDALSKSRALFEVGTHLLKDSGIKTKIIKQYVPVMNKLINKYLSAMDFFVNFELDESFNETIKSRGRDEFTYASFSEGEKMRIDLALMFTWRAIAKLRNSASTNLLIMDEVFDSSLDGPGTEEFLKILEGLTQDSNVFVISHKGDQLYDKFHSVIKFEKHANFSRIAA